MNELIGTRIRDHAARLALPHLAENLDGLLDRAETDTMGYLEFVDLLLGEEVCSRKGREFRTALKLSGQSRKALLIKGHFRLPGRDTPTGSCLIRGARRPCRCRWACGLGNIVMPFELDDVQHGVDKSQVGEGLRKIAQVLSAVRIDLLAVQLERTGE